MDIQTEKVQQAEIPIKLALLNKEQFRDEFDPIIEQLNTQKEYSFQYEGIPVPNICRFSLTTEPAAIGKILRLSMTIRIGNKTVEGYVYTTIPNNKTTSTIAILNKAWNSKDTSDVEGTGLMKLATAILMVSTLNKYSITKFGGILGKIVSDQKVVRSRPDGTYGSIHFNTNYNSNTQTLITTLSK